ncbi:Glutathione transferase III(b) [Planoprotostelium fungivorum]|uniref:glutathione transferase n=1 Tax=Planoprotostelium fungivorum TaxID=1890364 RepID=A0A2P6NTP8_9EUKA|nr:Glutathione transferase III(b) [Planoprotostelium fungivorum]
MTETVSRLNETAAIIMQRMTTMGAGCSSDQTVDKKGPVGKPKPTPVTQVQSAKKTPLKIKGLAISPAARRVFMVAEELGVEYELQAVDLTKGEHKLDDYVEKYQPFGQIPVLIDGDFQLFESRAIARYIANVHGPEGNTILPTDVKKRATVEQWISAEQSHFDCVSKIVGQLYFAPMFGGQPDQTIVEEADVKFKDRMTIFDRHLSSHSYFAGEEFTLADVCFMPFTDYLLKTKEYADVLASYPHFKAWWGRCSSLLWQVDGHRREHLSSKEEKISLNLKSADNCGQRGSVYLLPSPPQTTDKLPKRERRELIGSRFTGRHLSYQYSVETHPVIRLVLSSATVTLSQQAPPNELHTHSLVVYIEKTLYSPPADNSICGRVGYGARLKRKLTVGNDRDFYVQLQDHVFTTLLSCKWLDPSACDNEAIINASCNSTAEIVRLLLAHPKVDPSARKNAAILYASDGFNTEIVRLLLAHPKVDPSTILCATINFCDCGVIELLLADPRVDPSAQDNQAFVDAYNQPIINAAGRRDMDNNRVAQFLLFDPRVDPSGQDNQAIIEAVNAGNYKTVETLLVDLRGETDLVRLLLSDPCVDPSERDNEAFILAATEGYHEVIRLLLADDRVHLSTEDNEALKEAATNGHHEVVRLLLANSLLSLYLLITDRVNV